MSARRHEIYLRVLKNIFFMQALNISTLSSQTVNFLTNGILLAFISSEPKTDKSY